MKLSQLFDQISFLIEQARQQVQRQINTVMMQTYWEIGRLIIEDEQQGQARAEYGKAQLKQLSNKLTERFGKGFDITNLRNMRRFYQAFPIRETLSLELSWSHYNLLARVENSSARKWYMQEASQQSWSVRALERQINMLYYERLLSSKEKSPVKAEAKSKTIALADHPKDYLRDPYVLDFLNLQDGSYQEADLESGLISNLQQFLLALGKGFAFVERQQRIRTEDQDFYIDLVFYNYKIKCFLLIDLKLGKLSHQDVGQMDTYIRVYDQHKKDQSDNPTIGLILCSQKSEAVVKYSVLSDSEQLFAAKYMYYLPSEEELKKELQRERQLLQEQIESAGDENESLNFLKEYFLRRSQPRDKKLQNKIIKVQSHRTLQFFEETTDPLYSEISNEIEVLSKNYNCFLDSDQDQFDNGLKTNLPSRVFELIIADLIMRSGYSLEKRTRKNGMPDLSANVFFIECTSVNSSFFCDWDKQLPCFDEYYRIIQCLREKRRCNPDEPPGILINQVLGELPRDEIKKMADELQCSTENVQQNIMDWISLNQHISCYYREFIPTELQLKLSEININILGTRKIDYLFISKRVVKCIVDKVQKNYFQKDQGMLAISISFTTPGLQLSVKETDYLIKHLNENYEKYCLELIGKMAEAEQVAVLKGLGNLIAIILDTNWYNWFPSILEKHNRLYYSDLKQNNSFYLLYSNELSSSDKLKKTIHSCQEFDFTSGALKQLLKK